MFEYANITWEFVWMIALVFNIISYLEKNDKMMFIMLAICSFFYWIHFLWLWLLTASVINFFDVFKNLAVIKHKKNIKLFSIFGLNCKKCVAKIRNIWYNKAKYSFIFNYVK